MLRPRSIMNSLMPFFALPIETLHERLLEAETIPETFTLIVQNGKVELQWNDDYSRDTWWASRPRADAQINLMEPFLEFLEDFRSAARFEGNLNRADVTLGLHLRSMTNRPFCLTMPDRRNCSRLLMIIRVSLDWASEGQYWALMLIVAVSNHPNEDDRFEQDWHKACAPDSPLNKGEKELRAY